MQKRFNHYYLTEEVGSKPLRSAYLAHPTNDVSQKVLLKIFDTTCLALSQGNEHLFYHMEWIKRLRHAHMVPILDLGVEQGLPYVVSEYLSGGSLRHRLESLSPECLSLAEALEIVLQVGQALTYFHRAAHLHQNIKPENIFFNERGETLLADFQLSGFIDVAILDYQSDPRNMCYMAPEQFVGSASEKSDQYALACLAYELIAGQVPFAAQSFAMMWASHYAQRPIPLSDLVPDLPERVGKAVLKAMAKDPSERYADIAAFLLALDGTVLSPVPAITKPLALFTLDPCSADMAEQLDKARDDNPARASLAGIAFEGSLASAPFGAGLADATFGTSLTGVGFGTSLLGIPLDIGLPGIAFGRSLPGNPFAASLAGMAIDTGQKSENLEKDEKELNRSETSSVERLWRTTKYSIPALWPGRPRKPSAITRWIIQLRDSVRSLLSSVKVKRIHDRIRLLSLSSRQRIMNVLRNWCASSSSVLARLGRDLPTPALWLVLTLSIIVLMGGITSDISLTSQASKQLKSVHVSVQHHTTIIIDTQLIAQPVAHITGASVSQKKH
jgi:hypothetical protein